jgi:ABC-type spermidine/putrescine transport system permease subunit II
MGRGRMLRGFVYAIFALIALPLLVVVGVAFNPTERFAIAPFDASLRWFQEFFNRQEYMHALFSVTLPVACLSAAAATLIGTLAAIALVRFSFRGRALLEAIFMMPILIPGILLGVALYLFFARLNLAGTFILLVIGHTLIGIPFVTRVVGAGLAGINPAIEESAVNLGCSRVGAFCRVGLPLIRSSLVSGAILAFILSFSDVNISLFLTGPHTNTLPLQIFSDIQWQGDPTIAAASTIQIVVVTTLIILANRLAQKRLAF